VCNMMNSNDNRVYDLKVASAERPRVPLGSRPIRVVSNDLPMSRSDRSIAASSLEVFGTPLPLAVAHLPPMSNPVGCPYLRSRKELVKTTTACMTGSANYVTFDSDPESNIQTWLA